MIFKMKKHFVIYVILVTLFFKDCYSCFQSDSDDDDTKTSGSSFYKECCCTEAGYTAKELKWLDPNNLIIGPGTDDSNVFTEVQGEECLSLHIKSSSVSLSGSYKCVTSYLGVQYTEKHNLFIYNPLYFYNSTSATQYLIYGTDSKIYCEAKGSSSPRIKWSRGGNGENEILNSEKYLLSPDGLIIKNVTHEDAGIYYCTASVMSTGEEMERGIEAKVMTTPTITQLTASLEDVVTQNEPITIICEAEGFPEPEYTWNKISDQKSEKTNQTRWHQRNNSISINSVIAEDAGTYECVAHNFVGNNSKTIEIKVLVPPSIISFKNKTLTEGTETVIHCNATGIPPPNITIIYEGTNLTDPNSGEVEFVENDSIFKVTRSRQGYYICNATNEVNFATQAMYLTVLHPPSFDKDREIVWGWTGENVNLNCEPDANPPADINWRYQADQEDAPLEIIINLNLTSIVKNSQNYSVHIKENFKGFGLYECKATNKFGEAVKIFDLKLGHVPSKVTNATVDEVSASAASFIVETPTAYVGPEIIGFTAEYDTNESYSITNIHRNRTWAIGIPFKLDYLKPNTGYLIRFAAINRVGTGEWGDMIAFETLEKSAPEPPIWLSDSLQPSSSNVLKWKKPEDNGEPIEYYILRYCPLVDETEDAACKKLKIKDSTEKELTDLQVNTTYFFEILAHNSEGDSMPSNTSLYVPAVGEASSILSGGTIIGISVVIVLVCLVLLDVLLLVWRRQGIIASCCFKKSKKKPNPLHSRDKKGLLKDNRESVDDSLRRPNNGHKEYEYNKTTGIITGKHSSV